MLTLRRVLFLIGSGWVGAWTARILFDWILGFDGTVALVFVIAGFVVGALAGVVGARDIEEWSLWDQRDAYLGWVTFFGFVVIIVCLFAVPLPWGVLAAAVVAALTLVVLRRAPPAPERPG